MKFIHIFKAVSMSVISTAILIGCESPLNVASLSEGDKSELKASANSIQSPNNLNKIAASSSNGKANYMEFIKRLAANRIPVKIYNPSYDQYLFVSNTKKGKDNVVEAHYSQYKNEERNKFILIDCGNNRYKLYNPSYSKMLFVSNDKSGRDNIVEAHNNQSEELVLSQNVPNPCQGTTSFDLYLPNKENVFIEISDVLGRKITSFERNLEQGNHRFELNLEACQMYLLTVKTQSATSSIKIMNTHKSGLSTCILYTNTAPASTPIQKSNIQKFFLPGDSMIYIGYYQDKIKTINKKQNQNETIVFLFNIGN